MEKENPAVRKVVGFKRSEDRHQITQLQLEQLIYARRRFREAQAEYRRIRSEIQLELNSGAIIQSGVHTASVIASERLIVA